MIIISDIRDVARMANVSIGTVSNAFKRPEKVAPDTCTRILDIARELNYFPNQLASALVTSQTYLLGLMVSYSNAGHRGLAVNEFVRIAAKHGYMVIMASTDVNVDEETDGVVRFIRYRVDGVVVFSDFIEGRTEHIKILEENEIPCVAVKRFNEDYENISVSADHALKDIADQLKRYQHRHIGAVTSNLMMNDGTPNIRTQRLDTFRKKLKEIDLELKEKDILVVGNYTMETGEKVVDEWLALGQQLPTAIFCMNDYLAIGMIARFQKRGYRVPEDISIVGYGNYDAGLCCNPKLASVDIRETDIIKMAFDMIVERIKDPSHPMKNIEVEHKFILRSSLGISPNYNVALSDEFSSKVLNRDL